MDRISEFVDRLFADVEMNEELVLQREELNLNMTDKNNYLLEGV